MQTTDLSFQQESLYAGAHQRQRLFFEDIVNKQQRDALHQKDECDEEQVQPYESRRVKVQVAHELSIPQRKSQNISVLDSEMINHLRPNDRSEVYFKGSFDRVQFDEKPSDSVQAERKSKTDATKRESATPKLSQ